MNDPETWIADVKDAALQLWLKQQLALTDQIYSAHGDYPRWTQTLEQLSLYRTDRIDLSQALILIGESKQIDDVQKQNLKQFLLALHPWRKGPFNVFGIEIDSEWRSDKKWQRLDDNITPLKGRHVLDIGCGNGYYMLRMLGAGAAWVLGIDPTILFNMQFKALSQFSNKIINANILPVGIDQLPDRLNYFDTVFSMGVLYHRRSPIDHLYKLFSCLRPGGELVLETLVIEGPDNQLLLPASRYAKMRNVWFIPTAGALKAWLLRCGYRKVKIIDVSSTSLDEQRSTEWMRFESLSDFLDPDDHTKTIEGYPAPVRALICAQKPAS
ncbi:MAG: tRNA 5-methoxyuridine(34)/uridine 5-oxyacetic acid(34) synthase CmoB [Pseudomonadota bacterium]|nr:tRNA 5-methoxyuridine(34)/uridine 5-oxyacetic acid(34) synthase CmoB [Pseudomonadota bacterium]